MNEVNAIPLRSSDLVGRVIGGLQLAELVVEAPGAWLYRGLSERGEAQLVQILPVRIASSDSTERSDLVRSVAAATAQFGRDLEMRVISHGIEALEGGGEVFRWQLPWTEAAQAAGMSLSLESPDDVRLLAEDLLDRMTTRHARGRLCPLLHARLLAQGPGGNVEMLGVPIVVPASCLDPGIEPPWFAPEERTVGDHRPSGDLWRLGCALLDATKGREAPPGFEGWLERLLDPEPMRRFESSGVALVALQTSMGTLKRAPSPAPQSPGEPRTLRGTLVDTPTAASPKPRIPGDDRTVADVSREELLARSAAESPIATETRMDGPPIDPAVQRRSTGLDEAPTMYMKRTDLDRARREGGASGTRPAGGAETVVGVRLPENEAPNEALGGSSSEPGPRRKPRGSSSPPTQIFDDPATLPPPEPGRAGLGPGAAMGRPIQDRLDPVAIPAPRAMDPALAPSEPQAYGPGGTVAGESVPRGVFGPGGTVAGEPVPPLLGLSPIASDGPAFGPGGTVAAEPVPRGLQNPGGGHTLAPLAPGAPMPPAHPQGPQRTVAYSPYQQAGEMGAPPPHQEVVRAPRSAPEMPAAPPPPPVAAGTPPEVDEDAVFEDPPAQRFRRLWLTLTVLFLLALVMGVVITLLEVPEELVDGSGAGRGSALDTGSPSLETDILNAWNDVLLEAEPGDATFVGELDGQILGQAPVRLLVPPKTDIAVLVTAPGYEPVRLVLPSRGRVKVLLASTGNVLPCPVEVVTPGGRPVEGVGVDLKQVDGRRYEIPGAVVMRSRDREGAWLVRCATYGGQRRHRLVSRQMKRTVKIRTKPPTDATVKINGEVAVDGRLSRRLDAGFILVEATRKDGASARRWIPAVRDVSLEFPRLIRPKAAAAPNAPPPSSSEGASRRRRRRR